VRVLGEEPGLGLPNQHTKACPRFQAMHCWCPSATGPGQPHEKDCFQYTRPEPETAKWAGISKFKSGPFFGHGLQYQVQAYAAAAAIECTCAAKFGVIGHAAFCPLGAAAGEKAGSDAAAQ
jgi:hypothetical protein